MLIIPIHFVKIRQGPVISTETPSTGKELSVCLGISVYCPAAAGLALHLSLARVACHLTSDTGKVLHPLSSVRRCILAVAWVLGFIASHCTYPVPTSRLLCSPAALHSATTQPLCSSLRALSELPQIFPLRHLLQRPSVTYQLLDQTLHSCPKFLVFFVAVTAVLVMIYLSLYPIYFIVP